MKRIFSRMSLAIAVAALLPGLAAAQEVSQERIVKGLGKLTAAAPVIDLVILRE